jgi:hypothetical protein
VINHFYLPPPETPKWPLIIFNRKMVNIKKVLVRSLATQAALYLFFTALINVKHASRSTSFTLTRSREAALVTLLDAPKSFLYARATDRIRIFGASLLGVGNFIDMY